MPGLLDPLPQEGQRLVEFVGRTYAQFGGWPVWQFVVQQMWEKYDAGRLARGDEISQIARDLRVTEGSVRR